MDFNLQQFLTDMRDDLKSDNARVEKKVDTALESLHDHDTRLVVIEQTRKTLRWLAGTMIVAALGFVFDVVFSHLPKWFK